MARSDKQSLPVVGEGRCACRSKHGQVGVVAERRSEKGLEFPCFCNALRALQKSDKQSLPVVGEGRCACRSKHGQVGVLAERRSEKYLEFPRFCTALRALQNSTFFVNLQDYRGALRPLYHGSDDIYNFSAPAALLHV